MKTTKFILLTIIISLFCGSAQGSANNFFNDFIDKCSQKYELDKDLVHAVIKTESNYKPNAVSKSGAEGLMQLMPATAAELGVKDSFDPEQNINGGCAYLKKMKDLYKNDVLALAAYNAGPNAVKNWRRIPPYSETKRYVRKVIREYERRKHQAWFSISVKKPSDKKP